MSLKGRKKVGFDEPKPDTCLLQVKKAEFSTNDDGKVIFTGGCEIVEAIKHADNVGLSAPLFFNVHKDGNGKTFQAEVFVGLLETLKNKKLDIPDVEYFEDMKVQGQIEKEMPDMLFGAVFSERSWTSKSGENAGQKVTRVQITEYLTKKEYAEIKKKGPSASASGNDTQAAASSGAESSEGSGW